MKNTLSFYLWMSCAIVIFLDGKTTDVSTDVLSAHQLQKKLHAAHHEKLSIVSEADVKGHFRRIMDCHEKIQAIRINGPMPAKRINHEKCASAKCQIMRLVHQISFNIQSLMKFMNPEDIARIQILNEQIHTLKMLLKKYGIEDKTFENHPIGIYL